MRKLIRGKFDSQWKRNSLTKKMVKGFFMTAMDYTRYHKGGMGTLRHARQQPWETWRAFND